MVMKRRRILRYWLLGSGLIVLLSWSAYWLSGEWRKRQEAERVKSIAAHSFKVRSIDPADDDFSDLEPLVDIIGERRFVLMGETTHDDGATFSARTRLIRFLHQRLGFDVLVPECSYVTMRGLSDSLKSADLYRQFESDHPRLDMGILPKHRALIDFVHSTRIKGDRPVALLGCQIGYFNDTGLVTSVREFTAHFPSKPFSESQAERFETLLSSIIGVDSRTGAAKFGRMTQSEVHEVEELAGRLSTAIAEQRAELVRATSGGEVDYFEALIGSLPGFAAYASMSEPFHFQRDREQLNARDKAMADLIIHAARREYPKRKMVITAANGHLLRTVDDFKPMGGVVSMGDNLYRAFGDQMYTIVFEVYSGRSGEGAHTFPLPPASRNTMAHLFHQLGDDFRFLDLRGLPASHWLRRNKIGARALVYTPDGHATVWPNVVDGVFYLEQQQPTSPPATEETTIP